MTAMTPLCLEDFVTADEIAALRRPAHQAHGLPGRVYADPAFFELERRRLFPRTWMAIAYESDVAAPGDVLPVSTGGWDFIVARNRDGEVKVFHNICRHRSMTVVDKACSKAQTLQCPWHGWTYDLNGRLIATPDLGGVATNEQAGFDKAELGLRKVRAVTWMHWIFVNIDGQAEPFEDFIRPVTDRIADYDLSAVRFSGLSAEGCFEGNWKLAIETGCEDYHLPWVHPQIGKRSGWFEGGRCADSSVYIASRRAAAPDDPRTAPGPNDLPLFPHLVGAAPDGGLGHEIVLFFIVPSAILAVMPDHVVTNIYMPVEHDRTLTRRAFHFIGEAATDPAHAQRREAVRAGWIDVAEQDFPLVREVQTKHAQRDELAMATRFSPYWESAVHHFQNLVVDRLQA